MSRFKSIRKRKIHVHASVISTVSSFVLWNVTVNNNRVISRVRFKKLFIAGDKESRQPNALERASPINYGDHRLILNGTYKLNILRTSGMGDEFMSVEISGNIFLQSMLTSLRLTSASNIDSIERNLRTRKFHCRRLQ